MYARSLPPAFRIARVFGTTAEAEEKKDGRRSQRVGQWGAVDSIWCSVGASLRPA